MQADTFTLIFAGVYIVALIGGAVVFLDYHFSRGSCTARSTYVVGTDTTGISGSYCIKYAND